MLVVVEVLAPVEEETLLGEVGEAGVLVGVAGRVSTTTTTSSDISVVVVISVSRPIGGGAVVIMAGGVTGGVGVVGVRLSARMAAVVEESWNHRGKGFLNNNQDQVSMNE